MGIMLNPPWTAVRETRSSPAELLAKHAVLFLEVFNDARLLLVDPAREGHQHHRYGVLNIPALYRARSPEYR